MWTRRPHTGANNLAGISTLKETTDPERNQNRLLSLESLEKYGWVGQTLSDEELSDHPVAARGVMVASHVPGPSTSYRAQAVLASDVATTSRRSEIPQGLPASPPRDPSSESTPEDWGPRVADEDMDRVVRQLFPARGLRIEGRLNISEVFSCPVSMC